MLVRKKTKYEDVTFFFFYTDNKQYGIDKIFRREKVNWSFLWWLENEKHNLHEKTRAASGEIGGGHGWQKA